MKIGVLCVTQKQIFADRDIQNFFDVVAHFYGVCMIVIASDERDLQTVEQIVNGCFRRGARGTIRRFGEKGR